MQLFTHKQCLLHETPSGHPERVDRIRAIYQYFSEMGMASADDWRSAPAAPRSAIEAVHGGAYIDALTRLHPTSGIVSIDADTKMSPGSLEAAYCAAGVLLGATKAVLSNQTQTAFCVIRPPGHHAEAALPMGFCLFNSVAVAAVWALQQAGIERLAILDFDVHHGNGTVDIFKDDPRVLVCSSFQHPFYPGRFDDINRHHIVLTPLEAGANSRVFQHAIAETWFDRIAAHRPDLILVSAGFDAHRDDPLGGLNLLESDYQWLTNAIADLAADHASGRVVSALEGGYDLSALSRCAAVHVEGLMHAERG